MRKSLQFALYAFIAVGLLFISYILHISEQKQEYTNNLHINIRKFIHQQTISLQRLSNHMVPILRRQEYGAISTYLAAYEDVLYGMAKQGYTLAGNIKFVSLNAPQIVLGSKGKLDAAVVAPDQEYYSKIVADPFLLAMSHHYSKPEMPNYPLVNLGLGITDSLHNFYGVLELQLAVNSVQDYLATAMPQYNAVFGFVLTDGDLLHPKIYIQQGPCWQDCCEYIFMRLLLLASVVAVLYVLYYALRKHWLQTTQLTDTTQALQSCAIQLHQIEAAYALQLHYGTLVYDENDNAQAVNVIKLLQDIIAINTPIAAERAVTLHMAANLNSNLLIYAHKIYLLQILAGIMHEIILQLPPNSTIDIHVTVTKQMHGKELVQFSFCDNGYYDELHQREALQSQADIRCQGWENIMELIEEVGYVFEYSHQIYEGNTIKLLLETERLNNVVSFEQHLRELPEMSE